MKEVTEVRMSSWATMVKQRTESGQTIKAWCAENNISENVYYYRLRRLRRYLLETNPELTAEPDSCSGAFVALSDMSTAASDVALRIRRGDTTIEVSNNASDSILSLVKEVMRNAV